MVICFISIGLFAFLGLMLGKNKHHWGNILTCIWTHTTLRPCETTFHKRVKAGVVSGLMVNHMGIARFTHKYFEALSKVAIGTFFFLIGLFAYGATLCHI